MIKTILVTLDGSERSERVVEVASDFARKHGARLLLLHSILRTASVSELREIAERHGFNKQMNNEFDHVDVVPVSISVMGAQRGVMTLPVALIHELGELYLRKVSNDLKKKGIEEVKTYITGGDPAPEIVHLASNEDADLIIMGSRGLGDVKSMMLGSVSHKVLHDAKCLCLIVK